jgi:hypothetical protein
MTCSGAKVLEIQMPQFTKRLWSFLQRQLKSPADNVPSPVDAIVRLLRDERLPQDQFRTHLTAAPGVAASVDRRLHSPPQTSAQDGSHGERNTSIPS